MFKIHSDELLIDLQMGRPLATLDQITMVVLLSLPTILAQLSSIVMQYIDAAMVGRLGAQGSAAIGLVSSSTWLMGSLCSAATVGFSIQVAQAVGASQYKHARSIIMQGLVCTFAFSLLWGFAGALISGRLPIWLGGSSAITGDASRYFLIYALSIPFVQMTNLCSSMLQSSGNMRAPSVVNIAMCFIDVIANSLLIFPSGTVFSWLPGAGLGVAGAALGTACAEIIGAITLLTFMLFRSSILGHVKFSVFTFEGSTIRRAVKLSIPVAFENMITMGAQVASTKIVAPLGAISIAANSFAITAESLCYMPGYGIGSAATTIVGQSIGAKRTDLIKRLAWLSVALGIGVMTIGGILMFIFAPVMMQLLTPDTRISSLGAFVLRIEAFAEPLYAASIVCSGALRGAGDTLIPSIMNCVSIWLVRIPIAIIAVHYIGLKGFWIAMAAELCVRGIIFLIRLARGKWAQFRLNYP